MTFEEYKRFAAKPIENTKDTVFYIQEFYIKDISELFENGHCRCERVSCGFSKTLSTAKTMIQRRYVKFKYFIEKSNSLGFFTISECNYNKFTSPYTWGGDTIQHWSTDFFGKIIEHCQFYSYKGRKNHKNRYKIGDKVGVLAPFKTEVFLGEIVELPPSLKDVYGFREQYREQLKYMGARFSESEVLCSAGYPKEVYKVRINEGEVQHIVKIQTTLLIPLSNI